MTEPIPIYVLCCDDGFDEDQVQNAFDEDWERRRRQGEQRRLFRHGVVRKSVIAATGALETAERQGDLPDVILIDDYLKGPAGSRDPVPSAFELLRWIVARFAEGTRPLCLLITSRITPPLAHAFCTQGGSHVIDKTLRPSLRDQIEVIWRALDGERWRHSPDPPLIRFSPRELEILPYLAADRSPSETAAALGLGPPHVHQARSKLYGKLKKYDEQNTRDGRPPLIDFPVHGASTRLAEAALQLGAIWVPLEHQAPPHDRIPRQPSADSTVRGLSAGAEDQAPHSLAERREWS